MAQNGIDQTKSAGSALRARPCWSAMLGAQGGPGGTRNQLAVSGPIGALPALVGPTGRAGENGSKPATLVACPHASKAARPWQVIHAACATNPCSVAELPTWRARPFDPYQCPGPARRLTGQGKEERERWSRIGFP
jgi:hypothetical protein